jgi:hypothetical protein
MVLLIPDQLRIDSLPYIDCAEPDAAKKLTLPVQNGDYAENIGRICGKVVKEQQRLHVIGWNSTTAIEEISLQDCLGSRVEIGTGWAVRGAGSADNQLRGDALNTARVEKMQL